MRICLLIFTLLTILFLPDYSNDQLPFVRSFDMPATDNTKPNYEDDRDYEDFSGRLYIDDVDIDVALYHSNKQDVVDRKDAAAYFDLSTARGKMLIADHNTHAFGTLNAVKKGTMARIVRENGSSSDYICLDVFRGHNTGKGITDWNGNSVVGKADLLMYTCFDGWQNVIVTLWNEVEPPSEDSEPVGPLERVITYTQLLIEEMLNKMEAGWQRPTFPEEIFS